MAFNSGANDNFKGFATVWGSDTLGYRQALILTTLATLAGCVASWFLADTSVQQFSGRGLLDAGWGLSSGDVNLGKLASALFVPLLLSPLLAAGLGAGVAGDQTAISSS